MLVEECLRFDVRKVAKKLVGGDLGHTTVDVGPWYLRAPASVALGHGPSRIVIGDLVRGRIVGQTIELATTSPFFGGERWWGRCPGCNRRVGVIHAMPWPGAPWRCRNCLGLSYRSAQASHHERERRRERHALQ